MILGISCLLLFTVGVSYSKVMGNIIQEKKVQDKVKMKKRRAKSCKLSGINEEGKKYTYDAKKQKKN